MSKKTEQFLDEYKRLEKVISVSDRPENSVFDLETTEAFDPQKLKVCRIIRNYIQHNSDDFAEPTKEMIGYVKHVADSIESEKATVKDMMSRAKPVELTDKVVDAAKRLQRSNMLPVVDKDGVCVGLFDQRTVWRSVVDGAQNKKIKDIVKTLEKVPCTVTKETRYEDVKGISIVVNSVGKYAGVVTR